MLELTLDEVCRQLASRFGLAAPAPSDFPQMASVFRDQTVLITGAAGSIGAELVRWLGRMAPKRLILLDQDEHSLFDLQKRLAGHSGIDCVLGSIRDQALLRQLFAEDRPGIVLHAAAYKHLSMLESQVLEATQNNLLATRVLAEMAAEFGCQRFIFLSSDKAVRPTSVLGATKRGGELLMQYYAVQAGHQTRFASVRFGNVLGSRGSVTPIFFEQLAAGRPLTLTDEHMHRYFLTGPESARLVLAAASLAERGEVYVPQLGEPIKIVDLAEEIGRICDHPVRIQIVGRRPGEKRCEELTSQPSALAATRFPGLLREAVDLPPDFSLLLRQLEMAASSRRSDRELRALLFSVVAAPVPEAAHSERSR